MSKLTKYCLEKKKDVPKFQLVPVSLPHVERLIMSMMTMNCELDIRTTAALKEGLPFLIELLMDIINYSMKHGKFPKKWKTAIVRPLLKKLQTE